MSNKIGEIRILQHGISYVADSVRNFISGVTARGVFMCATAIFSLMLQGCFTGIESTKQIMMSKEDKKLALPTPEETILNNIHPTYNNHWIAGKRFLVVGERAAVLFEPRNIQSGNYSLQNGDTLLYLRSRTVTRPDGNEVVSVMFARGSDEFSFVPQYMAKNISSDALPGVIDLDMVEAADRILAGKELYTRSAVWVDAQGEKLDGRKFEKVRIIGVTPGDDVFPMKVRFRDEADEEAYIMINFDNVGGNSRNFANMFSLSDPRLSYKDISSSNWEKIRRGEVAEGMTKKEVRLSLGNPTEVNTGHDYSHVLLIWGYPDGMVLYFVDGTLRSINTIPKF